MPHLDPEQIARMVLGDRPSDAEQAHLEACAACAAEYRALDRAARAGRTADRVPLERPAPHVWRAVADELGLAPGVVPRAGRDAVSARRRRPLRMALVAVAAVAVAVAVAVGLAVSRSSAPIATATLQAFPGWAGEHGTAVVDQRASGRDSVVLTTNLAASPTTDHEVWLMTSDLHSLVSLGLLRGPDGTFAVPPGIDLRRYTVVDVSDEPRDGNPAHSGDSILRGPLHP